MFLQRNFFCIILTLLLILVASATFYRFMILEDYKVTYEVACDPYEEQCYYYCENEGCADIFYYKYLTKMVADLKPQCTTDITDCAEATYCSESDNYCQVQYCNANADDCEELTKQDSKQSAEKFFIELEKLKEQI